VQVQADGLGVDDQPAFLVIYKNLKNH
jgi:hypothetical protein